MNLAEISIRRPVFITCIIILMMAVGYLSLKTLPVDLFPDVNFPFIGVDVAYLGAGPAEMETLVAKPLEEQISAISGLKKLSTINHEGMTTVIAEFNLDVDLDVAEEQMRDKVAMARVKLPEDIEEPVVHRFDPAQQPIVVLALKGDLDPARLFDIADEIVKPKLEQVPQVGTVEIYGGQKREIQVLLDREILKKREMSVLQVAGSLQATGNNIPLGKKETTDYDLVFRSMGEYRTLDDIKGSVLRLFGNEMPTTLSDVGVVKDGLEDETSRAFLNGQKTLFLYVYKQSRANTVDVVDGIIKKMDSINSQLEATPDKPTLVAVRDASSWIRYNIKDVEESIFIGVFLTILVVFLFLANGRSTLITGLAIPNSLIGAFILVGLAGFSINIMTLLALSLSVGLLVDDAIVVRENIFRHIEMGKPPREAALIGSNEVRLAVIATTFAVIAVFGPVGFLHGVVGQFFKEFGQTICFIMLISLFDALTIAPMLSAYLAGKSKSIQAKKTTFVTKLLHRFDRFHEILSVRYEKILRFTLSNPKKIMLGGFFIFVASLALGSQVTKTFLPQQDAGEFSINLELPSGTGLEKTSATALEVDKLIRQNKEVRDATLTVGGYRSDSNKVNFYVKLVPFKERGRVTTSEVKDKIRKQLVKYSSLNPKVSDFDPMGNGQRPFNLTLIGSANTDELENYSQKVFAYLKSNPALTDVDTNLRSGKPEIQVVTDQEKAKWLGVNTDSIGAELRAQVQGIVPAQFRQNGREYDVRVRLQEGQRDLKKDFSQVLVSNMNGRLVSLESVASPQDHTGPATIFRRDRGRYIQLSADVTPGFGLGDVMQETIKHLDKNLPPPEGVHYEFEGDAEQFQQLMANMALALGLGTLFIYLVLASLYESFLTPLTIMLAMPLAICGSLIALLVTGQTLDIFSMIGCIMLMGIASKNSILLVDLANQLIRDGSDRVSALMEAGKTRLRPILMTTMALIAGMTPIAIGLNEASRQRVSMGIAIIGGLISSTLLTLVIVPAAFLYMDRFSIWAKDRLSRLVVVKTNP